MLRCILFICLALPQELIAQRSFELFPGLVDSIEGRFDDLFFLDDSIGWMCSSSGKIYKTTDGGINAKLVYHDTRLEGYFRSIEFFNEDIGLCGSLDSFLLRTTDGGETWSSVALPKAVRGFCGMHFFANGRGFISGSINLEAYIMKTEDYGVTWEYENLDTLALNLIDICFVSNSKGFVTGRSAEGGIILQTLDGGRSWQKVYASGTPGDFVWKIHSLWNDSSFVYASIQSDVTLDGLCVSEDQGETWRTLQVPAQFMQGVGFITPLHGWMGGHQSPLVETRDGGKSWIDVKSIDNLNRIQILNDEVIFAAGNGVFSYTDSAITTFSIAASKPSFTKKIFPNPTQQELTYQIELEKPNNLQLRLYNVAGALIREFPYRRLQIGIIEFTLNLEIPPGRYQLVSQLNEGHFNDWILLTN